MVRIGSREQSFSSALYPLCPEIAGFSLTALQAVRPPKGQQGIKLSLDQTLSPAFCKRLAQRRHPGAQWDLRRSPELTGGCQSPDPDCLMWHTSLIRCQRWEELCLTVLILFFWRHFYFSLSRKSSYYIFV